MISKKLAERTFVIKGSPLPDRAQDSFSHRRGTNAIVMEDDELSEKYDTFFEYEDDLADLKPSSEQYADMVSDEPYVILEDRDVDIDESEGTDTDFGGIIMDDAEEIIESNKEKKTYKDVVGFAFIQCSFIKSDGERCKRQAPSGQEICSVHRKYIEKHKS